MLCRAHPLVLLFSFLRAHLPTSLNPVSHGILALLLFSSSCNSRPDFTSSSPILPSTISEHSCCSPSSSFCCCDSAFSSALHHPFPRSAATSLPHRSSQCLCTALRPRPVRRIFSPWLLHSNLFQISVTTFVLGSIQDAFVSLQRSTFLSFPMFFKPVSEFVSIPFFLFFRPWQHFDLLCRVGLLSSNSPCYSCAACFSSPTTSISTETTFHWHAPKHHGSFVPPDRVFVVPYQSLLLVTLCDTGQSFLSQDGHEDDKYTLCMFQAITHHSFPSSPSSPEDDS